MAEAAAAEAEETGVEVRCTGVEVRTSAGAIIVAAGAGATSAASHRGYDVDKGECEEGDQDATSQSDPAQYWRNKPR